MTKTRKFVVNGVVMTSQTSKIVADEMKKQQEHQLWSVNSLNHHCSAFISINYMQIDMLNIVCIHYCAVKFVIIYFTPLSSTWPHLNSDVGLEKGEY